MDPLDRLRRGEREQRRVFAGGKARPLEHGAHRPVEDEDVVFQKVRKAHGSLLFAVGFVSIGAAAPEIADGAPPARPLRTAFRFRLRRAFREKAENGGHGFQGRKHFGAAGGKADQPPRIHRADERGLDVEREVAVARRKPPPRAKAGRDQAGLFHIPGGLVRGGLDRLGRACVEHQRAVRVGLSGGADQPVHLKPEGDGEEDRLLTAREPAPGVRARKGQGTAGKGDRPLRVSKQTEPDPAGRGTRRREKLRAVPADVPGERFGRGAREIAEDFAFPEG